MLWQLCYQFKLTVSLQYNIYIYNQHFNNKFDQPKQSYDTRSLRIILLRKSVGLRYCSSKATISHCHKILITLTFLEAQRLKENGPGLSFDRADSFCSMNETKIYFCKGFQQVPGTISWSFEIKVYVFTLYRSHRAWNTYPLLLRFSIITE